MKKINFISLVLFFIVLIDVQLNSQNLYWSLGGVNSHWGYNIFTNVNVSQNKQFIVNTDDLCNYKFYDLATGIHFKTITDTSSVYGTGDFLIYDDDKILISHSLKIFDINSSKILRELEKPVLNEQQEIVNYYDFQSCLLKGKKTIIAQNGMGFTNLDRGVHLIFWDFESGKILKIYNKLYKNYSMKSFIVTKDNKLLLNYERFIVLYNPETDINEKEITPDPKEEQFIQYSNNSISSINSLFYDDIKLYDYSEMKFSGSIKVSGTSSQSKGGNIGLSPNGSKLLYKIGPFPGNNTPVGLANTVSKKEMFQFFPPNNVDNNIFIDENTFLTSIKGGFELMLYHFNDNGITQSVPIAPFTGVLTSDIEYSKNGLMAVNTNIGVYLFDFNKKTLLKSIYNSTWVSDKDYRLRWYDIELSDDGKYLGYIENAYNRVYIYNIEKDTIYSIENAHKKLITCLKILPDQNKIITGSSDAIIKIWDLNTRELIDSIYLKVGIEDFSILDFSSFDNFKTLVVIGHDQNGATNWTLKVDLENKQIEKFVHNPFVYWDIFPASFSSNGKYFADASSFDKIEIIDLSNVESKIGYKQFLYSEFLKPELNYISALGISQNGNIIAVSYPEDTRIDIFYVQSDKLQFVQTIQTGLPTKIYDGLEQDWKFAPINLIKFSPDDKYISISTYQNNLYIYDISQITSVNEETKPDDILFNIYPNPVLNILYISHFTQDIHISDNIKVIIYQSNMTRVYENNFIYNGGSIPIDVHNLLNGIYFVELVSKNNRIFSKFLKK